MVGSESLLQTESPSDGLDCFFAFIGLPNKEQCALRGISSEVKIRKGNSVFYEGDKNKSLFMVISGAVRLTKLMVDGRYQITGFCFNGDFLGISIEEEYVYSAEALSETTLFKIDARGLSRILLDYPLLAHYFLELSYNDLRAAQDHMIVLGRRSATERVCGFLISLHQRIGTVEEGKQILRLPMDRTDIAAYTGLTTETVCRIFSNLRTQNIISHRSPSVVTIVCPDEIERLSITSKHRQHTTSSFCS